MNGTGTRERIETAIIGGGQAGLAMGYHLSKAGRPFLILDENERVGDAWRKRWDSLRVFSPARFDGLPGMPFPRRDWYFPTKDEMADYLAAYATRFALPVRTGVTVTRLSRESQRFVITAGQRQFEADRVVVASGADHTPRIPEFARDLDPAIYQIHSSEYRNPAQLRPGGVLLVGAGNSGAEIALDVSRTHRTWLSGRYRRGPVGPSRSRYLTPLLWIIVSRVLTIDTPMGRKVRRKLGHGGPPVERVKLADLASAGIELLPRTAGTRNGSPLLEDGRVLDVSNVIWCTGFRTDLGWIDLPIFGEDGEPVHVRGIVPAVPGLYFLGRFFQYSLSSSFIGGVGRDAKYIAKQIAGRQVASTTAPAPVRGVSP
jgi:putative flavoprotein involved in K+ transport